MARTGGVTPKLPPARTGARLQRLLCLHTSVGSEGLSPLSGGVGGGSDPLLLPKAQGKGTSFPHLRYYSRE